MFYKFTIVCAVALFMSANVWANDEDLLKPPVIPPPLESGDSIESQVEITSSNKDGVLTEEYRVNGQLYMIKVTPAFGPPYYFIDSDGNGSLESRHSQFDGEMAVPNWILFEW